jgi:hypothetical protein
MGKIIQHSSTPKRHYSSILLDNPYFLLKFYSISNLFGLVKLGNFPTTQETSKCELLSLALGFRV